MNKSPKKAASASLPTPAAEAPVTFYNHTMDLTESIRDKVEELRSAKQERFELLKSQLEVELHDKNHLQRNVYHEFEQAVAVYQKVAEQISLGINISPKSETRDITSEPSSQPVRSASPALPSPSETKWEPEEAIYDQEYSYIHDDEHFNEPPPLAREIPNRDHVDPQRSDPSSALYDTIPPPIRKVSSFRPAKIPTFPNPVTQPPTPAPAPAPSSAIVPTTTQPMSVQMTLQAHQDLCQELKRRSDALSASVQRTHQKLLLAREDYQRSLRSFDDLEAELCITSSGFEEHQKCALERFWEGLNKAGGSESLEIYEEYGKVQEEVAGKKRKRGPGAPVAAFGAGRVDELEREVKRAKRTRNMALGVSLMTLAGLAGNLAINFAGGIFRLNA